MTTLTTSSEAAECPSGDLVRVIGARRFDFARQVAVMAVVNRTRDSFFDRGRTFDWEPALDSARSAIAQGADWVDIGAVPFSPLAAEVSQDEELARVLPLVEELRAESDVVISVDTFRPEVARRAVAAGATAINDTSGLRDLRMAEVAADSGVTLVITHSLAPPRARLSRPRYGDVVTEVRDFLLARADAARTHGVRPEQVVLDPGHDLNKNTLHSLELTRRLEEITGLGYPVLASVSNKDFVGESLGRPVDELREGSLAAVVICVLGGARIVRVHDVAGTVAAVRLTETVAGWREPARLRHNLD